MRDLVKVLATLGRHAKKLLAQAEQLRFEDARAGMLQALDDNVTSRAKDPRDENLKNTFQRLKAAGRWADARLLGIEQIIAWLDGDKPDGPWRKYLWQPIADAEHNRNDLDLQYTVELIKLLDTLRKASQQEKAVYLPELQESLSHEGVIAAALNTGNAGNLQRLAATFNVPESVVLNALDQVMSKADWELVQGIWDQVNELWPLIVKTEEQTTGLRPKQVDAQVVKTCFGEFRGGYYPIMYDRTRSTQGRVQSDVDRQFKGGYGRVNVKGGFTKQRVEVVDAPLLLSLDVLPRHLSQATHLITHKRAIMDANKILRDRELHQALSEKLGSEYVDMFVEWIDSVAKDGFITDSAASFFGKLRSNSATAIMGFSATTFISQFAGYSAAAEIFRASDADGNRMGMQYFMTGMRSFLMEPLKQTEVVRDLSGEMRHRMSTIDRDLREQHQRILGRSNALNQVRHASMWTIGLADMMVSVPTWLGAYHWAIDQGYDSKTAIEWADSRVRLSQSTGSVKDLSSAQRSSLLKAFTMFYGYFKALWGRQRDIGRDYKNGVGFFEIALRSFLLVVIPATLFEALVGRGPDCEDEGVSCLLSWVALKTLVYSLSSVPVVREGARLLENPGNFSPTPVLEAIRFTGQAFSSLAKEEDAAQAFMKNAAKAIGFFYGLPVIQIERTRRHVWEYIDGDIDKLTVYELILGPKR